MALNQNPIQYTSRTYNTILSDINSDTVLAQKPNWFKRLIAGIGDSLSIWLNSMINLVFLRTAYTRSAVQDLCQLIDYYMAGQVTSSGYVCFQVDTASGTGIFPFTLQPVDLRAKSIGLLSTSSLPFESRLQQTFSLVQATFTTNYAVNSKLTVGTDFLYTGLKCRVSSSGTLPNPILATSDYYLIYYNSTTVGLATSLSNAYANNFIVLTTNGTGVQTLTLYSKAVLMYQQNSLSASVNIGSSDGLTVWQEFVLPDQNVLTDTLTVTINSVAWTAVTTFVNFSGSAQVFKIYQRSNGQYAIRFGNGTYGAIPPAFPIYALYATGGGVNANINSPNIVTLYTGASTKITGVSNSTIMNGAADQETIVNAKNMAPALLKATNRFITQGDGVALILAYGGVANCVVNKNTYGVMSAQICGIATGGGDVGSALRATIQTYLINKSVLGSVDARFIASTLNPITISVNVNLLSSYSSSSLDAYIKLAIMLFFAESGKQINDTYQASGIGTAVTLINNLFSNTFAAQDYSQIAQLLSTFGEYYRNYGDTLALSSFNAFVQGNITGINSITLVSLSGSNPFFSGFPYTCGGTEITTNTGGSIVVAYV